MFTRTIDSVVTGPVRVGGIDADVNKICMWIWTSPRYRPMCPYANLRKPKAGACFSTILPRDDAALMEQHSGGPVSLTNPYDCEGSGSRTMLGEREVAQ
eukprot:SAG11_NODE_411_length_9696_cov_46.841513_12_plen_98_part_01